MALYIRDESVNDLAKQVTKATGAENKTEAVRAALQARLDAVKEQKPMSVRIRELRALADQIGDPSAEFDMKAHSDEMWGDA